MLTAYLHSGDTLVVWKLGHLGRTLRDVVRLAAELTRREVGLRILAGGGAPIDTTAPDGQSVSGVFAGLAEFERETTTERTTAGLAAARARGRLGGRPYKMTPARLRHAQDGMSQRDGGVSKLCAEPGITRQTLYRHVHPKGRLRPDGERLLRRRHWKLDEEPPPGGGRMAAGQRHA